MQEVAIVGSGPTALMCADVVAQKGYKVRIFEKRNGAARKLFIAGSSGLNISNSLPISEFAQHYSGSPTQWRDLLKSFSPKDWLKFIEDLGIGTFEGTSGRYFVETMNAAKLVRLWRKRLTDLGVQLSFNYECSGFNPDPSGLKWQLFFADEKPQSFDAICFALGGGSWEPDEKPLRWPEIFIAKKLPFKEFYAANVGYKITWPKKFLEEAEGLPLKNIRLTSKKGSRLGDAVVTDYGIEGTPVYFVGTKGTLKLDLKPDMPEEKILQKCLKVKQNLSPIRRIKKHLNLCEASLALIFHLSPDETKDDLKNLVKLIKNFSLTFDGPQPLDEAISSAGGLGLATVNDAFMLKKFPGVFAAGEMLDWAAPTGGFLIQGCVSQGYAAGKGLIDYLSSRTKP